MKIRIILVIASCLLSVVIGIVLSQQRISRDLDERIREEVRREIDRRAADVARIDRGADPESGKMLIRDYTIETRADSGVRQPAGARNSQRKLVIGLSMDTLHEERWKGDRDMFLARAKELGAEVEVLDANSDDTRQIQQVKSLLTKDLSALVIIPHDGAVMAEGVRLAHEKGIRVLAYDRIIKNADLDLYATFDNVRVGELQAKFIVDHAAAAGGGKKRIVRIYGSETDNNAFLFKQGQDNVLKPLIASRAFEVVHEQHAHDWKPENAKMIMQAALTKTRDIDYVLASNDGTAGGAIQALTEAGLARKVVVTGQDAELVACQRIANGTQAMTIYKPLSRLARRGAELAVSLAKGEPIVAKSRINNGKIDVPSELLDVVLVTKENLRETVVADGFHKAEAVFQGL
jgi:D-xylose transport system substrate-binding protein